jgi:hypothetical protein
MASRPVDINRERSREATIENTYRSSVADVMVFLGSILVLVLVFLPIASR